MIEWLVGGSFCFGPTAEQFLQKIQKQMQILLCKDIYQHCLRKKDLQFDVGTVILKKTTL